MGSWGGACPQSRLTMYHERAKRERESQRFEETLRGSKSKSPHPPHPPFSPNLFSHPHLSPTLAKKSASTCRIRKDGLQKYPQTQESSRNRAPLPPPSLLLLLLLLFSFRSHLSFIFFFYNTGHCTKKKKCKCCRPRQRLRRLFQRVTPALRVQISLAPS